MQFKPLELDKEGKRPGRTVLSTHFKKSVVAIIVGAVAGFGLYYLTEGSALESIPGGDILKSMAIGGFFGFFFTNSPCARGRC